MKTIKLLAVSQVLLFTSLFLTWISTSHYLSIKSINDYIFTFTLICNQLLLAILFLIIDYFRKLGTSKTKKIGTIIGYIFLVFLFMYNCYFLTRIYAFKYLITNLDSLDSSRIYDLFNIHNKVLLFYQPTFTSLLVLFDLVFMYFYFKSMSSYSTDDIKIFMSTYKTMCISKPIKRIYWCLFLSVVLITMCGFQETPNNLAIFVTRIVLLLVSYGFLSSQGVNNRNIFKTSKTNKFYFKLQISFGLSAAVSFVLTALLYNLDNMVFQLINTFTPLIYSIPTIILFEQMNCYYSNFYKDKLL